MASYRIAANTYGYTVCFASLVVFGYALAAVIPTYRQIAERRQLPEESAITIETMATDTSTMSTETAAIDTMATTDSVVDQEALAAFRRAAEADRAMDHNLRAAQVSLENAKMQLAAERERLRKLVFRLHLAQRGLLMLFAAAVFTFHWRWLRRFAENAA